MHGWSGAHLIVVGHGTHFRIEHPPGPSDGVNTSTPSHFGKRGRGGSGLMGSLTTVVASAVAGSCARTAPFFKWKKVEERNSF